MKSLFEKANKELEHIYDWMVSNKLTINTDKSNFIIFHNRYNLENIEEYHIKLGNTELDQVKCTKFLGIKIDENLNWKSHMEFILSKTRHNLGVVCKISPFINKDALYQLYFALIMSHLRYGILVWHHGCVTMRKKMQACSNNLVRLIHSLPSRQSVRVVMKDNNLLSLNQIYHIEIAKLYHKLENGTIPECFKQLFENQNRATGVNTRSHSNYFQPFCRINLTQQAFNVQGPKIWNAIPIDIKMDSNGQCLEEVIFKKNIKEYAINHIDYI